MDPLGSTLDLADEAVLIARAQGGDLPAFEPLVNHHLPQVRAFIALRAPAAHLVDELAHETFVYAYRNIQGFAAGTAFGGWLRSIAWNLLRAEILRFSREQANRLRYAEARRLELSKNDPASSQEAVFLQQCVERLPGSMRQLLNLKYQAEQSSEEIARELKRSAEWVRITLFRVRQQLKACIESKLGGNKPC
jgi:RNA polymerase sigma-70 factor, ECF subfamily